MGTQRGRERDHLFRQEPDSNIMHHEAAIPHCARIPLSEEFSKMDARALCSQKRTPAQPFVGFSIIQQHLFLFLTVQLRYSQLHTDRDRSLSAARTVNPSFRPKCSKDSSLIKTAGSQGK